MNNEQIERVAKALCAETCAFAGEPPCYSVEGDWPNPECDEPGCHSLAARAIAAMQPDAQAIRDAALREILVRLDDLTGHDMGMSARDERCVNAEVRAAIALLNKENTDD